MKRKFEHPAPAEGELTGPRYWRSLDELAATEGFKAQVDREFPEGASGMEGVDRRQFFKLISIATSMRGVKVAEVLISFVCSISFVIVVALG